MIPGAMQDGGVSGPASVRDILYRAGSDGTVRGTKVPFASASQGVAAILRHMEDCVLPRRVVAEFDSGARIAFEVAERQVVELSELEMPAPLPALQSSDGPPLSPGPLKAGDAPALAGLLTALCRRAASVSLTLRPSEEEAVGGGFSLPVLWAAAGIPDRAEPDASYVPWIEAIVDHPKVNVRSAVLIDVDEAHVVAGSKDEAEALADWAVEMLDVFLAERFPLAPELETKGAVVFAPQRNGSHILLCGLRGQFLLALVSGPDTAGSMSVWRRISETEIDGYVASS